MNKHQDKLITDVYNLVIERGYTLTNLPERIGEEARSIVESFEDKMLGAGSKLFRDVENLNNFPLREQEQAVRVIKSYLIKVLEFVSSAIDNLEI